MSSWASSLPRYRVLDVPFNPITRAGTREHCMRAVASDHFHLMVTLGTEMVMDAQVDETFREIVEQADLVVPDGIGVVMASRMAGLEAPERVTGVDLVHDLIEASDDDVKFFFYGSAPGIAEKAVSNLQSQVNPFNCVGIFDGYVKDQEVVLSAIEESAPQILFVALGFPRQEAFLSQNRERLEASGVRLGVGVGGSFDVYAGAVERAPAWVQKFHLEWAYRLYKQPSRWRRMMALPRFAIRVLLSPKSAVRSVS
jgi:N-acetylglucosaminyldiphosphoundecaprenol N-acetyl-beta-D-mannosaminyltransferase